MVSVCLPSDALLQHLSSYLGFSYLGCGISLQGCSRKVQPLLFTLEEGYLLTAACPDLECGIAPLGPLAPVQPQSLDVGLLLPAPVPGLGHGTAPPHRRPWPRRWGLSPMLCTPLQLPMLCAPSYVRWKDYDSTSSPMEDNQGFIWNLEKEMATHSNVLSWRIPWREEPVGVQSMQSQRVGYYWVTNTLSLKMHCFSHFIQFQPRSASLFRCPSHTHTHTHTHTRTHLKQAFVCN